jgi:hypothetical protein
MLVIVCIVSQRNTGALDNMVFLNAGVDIKFLQKAEQTVSNPHFIPRNNNFTIKHYAGDVTYDVDGMYDYMYIHAGHARCSAAPLGSSRVRQACQEYTDIASM